MGGYDLNFGTYKKNEVSSEKLWKAFNKVFATRISLSSTYKFVFLKSLFDCVYRYKKCNFAFFEVFERFAEIYWILVVKYGLSHSNSTKNLTSVEQILIEYTDNCSRINLKNTCFDDLPITVRKDLINSITKKCKVYVVGALFKDTDELFYSFNKKEETIIINPIMLQFIVEHKKALEELNYFELSKFLVKVNTPETNKRISDVFNVTTPVNAYRQLLFNEFEANNSLHSINSVEILLEAENSLRTSSLIELENEKIKKEYINEVYLEQDITSMMSFLDDPERVIHMLKARKKIRFESE